MYIILLRIKGKIQPVKYLLSWLTTGTVHGKFQTTELQIVMECELLEWADKSRKDQYSSDCSLGHAL